MLTAPKVSETEFDESRGVATERMGHAMFRPFSLIMLMLIAAPVAAQAPQSADPTVPVAPPKAAPPPPERVAPSNENLPDRLSRQKGTIVLPSVDQGMQVNPPRNSGATMPVIPPPGSPGGNRSVVPK
jgi:hypothetical protein